LKKLINSQNYDHSEPHLRSSIQKNDGKR
jgi:hypothetical protein